MKRGAHLRIDPRAVVAQRVAWTGVAVFATGFAALGLYSVYHALSGPLIGPVGGISGGMVTGLLVVMATSLVVACVGSLFAARHRRRVETVRPERIRPDIAA